MDEHLLYLAAEYTELVDAMRFGRYDTHELHTLDSNRQVVHNQLREHTGLDPDDMYQYCRAVLLAARAGGYR